MAALASDARPDLDAGNFSLWLTGLQVALRNEGDSDVQSMPPRPISATTVAISRPRRFPPIQPSWRCGQS